MGDLIGVLRGRVDDNAQTVVDTCASEVPEYGRTVTNPVDYARMLEFSVFIRRRTLELVTTDHPLTEDDLAVVRTIGEERGEKGMSRSALDRVLALHATASLREIHETAGPKDLRDAMHLLAWLSPQGAAGQQAYTIGFLKAQKRYLPIVEQTRQFAEMAMAGDPATARYAQEIGLTPTTDYRVVAVRTTTDLVGPGADEVLNVAWHRHRTPATWRTSELVAVMPADQNGILALVQDIAGLSGPIAVGTAVGPVTTLADTVALARRVSGVVRAEPVPQRLYTVADVFIEIGVAGLADIDRWLRHIACQLTTGPDLLATLSAYYRHDLNRTETAAALNIHPRTLDYRLRRTRELIGLDPASTHGIRVLTTAVQRADPVAHQG
ncbi:helix-turn-helix domain-containing protein [Kibdelosporangium lantanae]